jgi:hypothetical protein
VAESKLQRINARCHCLPFTADVQQVGTLFNPMKGFLMALTAGELWDGSGEFQDP